MNTQSIAIKRQMMENYLKQQQMTAVNTPTPSVISEQVRTSGETNAIISFDALPDDIGLAEFKAIVKKWLEYDNFIKRAKEMIKEKRKQQEELAKVITKFMCKNNIDDINTKEGKIKCCTTMVKAPVSQKIVKQRITDYFKIQGNNRQADEVLHKIFEEREQVQRVSLRRLKIT